MRILTLPADCGGCGSYRLIWPTQALMDAGVQDVAWKHPVAGEADPAHNLVGAFQEIDGVEHLVQLQHVPDYDCFVFQRPLQIHVLETIQHLKLAGKKVIVELDDDFTSVSAQNISWRVINGQVPGRSVKNILTACAVADLVTVSTPALARVYGRYTQRPPVVIPNLVPRRYLETGRTGLEGRPPDRLLLGWSGSVETHPQDLTVVGGAVAQALRAEPRAKLAVIGTGKGVARAFGTKADGEVLITNWLPIEEYPGAMAEIDVGMVPLTIEAFNEGKSWLKGIEFASVGVPFVASPTEQYRSLAKLGIGQVANNPREWKAKLLHLLKNDDERLTRAADGRLLVEKHLVMEDNLERWMDAWATVKNA